MRRSVSLALPLALGLGAAACGEPSARPQIVLIVDADVPTAAQAAANPDLSGDAAIDTLRVDILDASGQRAAPPRELVVPDAADWPVSFGIVLDPGESTLVRIWGFRGVLATATTVDGQEIAEPIPEAAIVRVVQLSAREEGVEHLRVVLRGDCIGTLPSFGSLAHTCIDGERLAGGLDEGIEAVPAEDVPTVTGSWPSALAVPCDEAKAAEGRSCIPGGFTRLGDPLGSELPTGAFMAALPYRPVILRPFYLDDTEVSVGIFRAIFNLLSAPAPLSARDDPYCTWLGADDAANDLFPLNCVSPETAAAVCAALGGALPTEAQWEHAARGRGQGRAFPWGPELPECCSANLGLSLDGGSSCGMGFIAPVGSSVHEACAVGPDVSRDGVLDLAGSVSEITGDAARAYDDECWHNDGVPVDPRCDDPAAFRHTTRGGNWGSSAIFALSAARGFNIGGIAVGFRCAYEGAP